MPPTTAVTAALHHRAATGKGQVVDSSLYESVLQVMESLVTDYAVTGYIRERSGSILPGIAPSNEPVTHQNFLAQRKLHH